MKRKKVKMFRYGEVWATRYGTSKRLVTRDAKGRFVDQASLRAVGFSR
jgi:hypothetical protein